jgi:hypothetical protein
MANPFPFVAGSVLTAAELNGIGEWTDYTPALFGATTNPVMGNSAVAGKYARVQNLIIAYWSISIGSTFVNGSGDYTINLPVTAVGASSFTKSNLGSASFYDNSANSFYFCQQWLASTTRVQLANALSFNGNLAGLNQINPVVPATNDVYSGVMIYKAA